MFLLFRYGPEFWMNHEIVVVTFNYRLGPLGRWVLKYLELLRWSPKQVGSYLQLQAGIFR